MAEREEVEEIRHRLRNVAWSYATVPPTPCLSEIFTAGDGDPGIRMLTSAESANQLWHDASHLLDVLDGLFGES